MVLKAVMACASFSHRKTESDPALLVGLMTHFLPQSTVADAAVEGKLRQKAETSLSL
jgi:hypothetical protein